MKTGLLMSMYNYPLIRKAVDWAGKESAIQPELSSAGNLQALKKHLPAWVGIWYAGFYVLSILKSKDIPEDRKRPLVINSIFTGIVGALGGYALSGFIERFAGALEKRFEEIIAKNPEKILLKKGFKSVVPLFAFSAMFRYICPVISIYAADKINKFLLNHKSGKEPANNKPFVKTA